MKRETVGLIKCMVIILFYTQIKAMQTTLNRTSTVTHQNVNCNMTPQKHLFLGIPKAGCFLRHMRAEGAGDSSDNPDPFKGCANREPPWGLIGNI